MNLVFIHGAGGSSKVWTYQKRYFSDHETTLVNLPGHGGTSGDGRKTIFDYVEDVRKYIKSGKSCILIGHSMGGAITLSYVLKYPAAACVLAGTGAKLRVVPAILRNIVDHYEQTVDLILDNAIHNKTEQIMAHSRREMLATPPHVTYNDFLACDTFNVMEEIHRISIPTLVIAGRQDVLTPLKYSQYLADNIKGARLEIIENCGQFRNRKILGHSFRCPLRFRFNSPGYSPQRFSQNPPAPDTTEPLYALFIL
ncbi:MAG: alpha/beta hydrolase [Theionarchaea archaeon]|nr:alpha/beta hydrolase [Theionarchaea archaeon]